jgi:serine/threonine protein kinase
MKLLDASLPTDPKASRLKDASTRSGHDRDGVDATARTDADASIDRERWDKLEATRIVDTVTPEATPVSGSRAAPVKPTVGATIGDYQLLDKLGEGAMGAVYRARQISFERVVALKILFNHVAAQPKLVQRLYREARTLAQLDHPNVVQAFGVGEEAGCHYVAMEFIDGKNLQIWLRQFGKLSVADALAVTLAVARGLAHAHSQGFIHRDIKPENILISKDGQVKVADLGMVKADDEDLALTQTGHALGTPWYMPLEQARNAKEIDARSDIYALGGLLYCLLTGHPPFQGRTIVELIQAKERGVFPTARSQNAEVPERLDLILVKMTAKSPAQRYQNCNELIADLERLGLAGDRFSFVHPSDGSQKTTPGPEAHTITQTADFDPHIWYVRIPRRSGRQSVKRLTTEQVEILLDTDQLKPSAQASHHADNGFRALSTYKEFSAASTKATREAADEATSKFRQLYKKIEDQEQARDDVAHSEKALRDAHRRYYLELAWDYGRIPLGILLAVVFVWWVARLLN